MFEFILLLGLRQSSQYVVDISDPKDWIELIVLEDLLFYFLHRQFTQDNRYGGAHRQPTLLFIKLVVKLELIGFNADFCQLYS